MTMTMEITTVEQWREVKAAGEGDKPLVVGFWAEWHEPSRAVVAVFDDLKTDYPGLQFATVQPEMVPEAAQVCKVEAVPAVVVIQGEKVVGRVAGAAVPAVVQLVQKFAAGKAAMPKKQQQMSLDERIQMIINNSPVMLFMKGSPETPRCGFSRKTVELLNKYSVSYGHFDILQDEAVRQRIKEMVNWPTFPMLFVEGQLVGGLDVLNDLDEAGELEEMLKDAQTNEMDSIDARLKKLINSHKVMLFMKGNPDQPRCGFSNKIVEILKSKNVEFGHFDILQDEEVRRELKRYSSWPTFPQLYCSGTLIGGLDVVQDLNEDEDLDEILAG